MFSSMLKRKAPFRKKISLTCSIDARNFPQSSGRTMNSIVTVTGPSSSFGAEGKSCKPSNGAGSSLRVCAKLIESGIANARLALRRMAPPTSVLPSPKEVVDQPQRIAPSATPPCDTIMCTAFIRPRAQSGIARWPAIQSSDADTVQLMPARAAIGRKIQTLGTTAISTKTATRITLARIVSVFGPADRWANDPAQVYLHAAQNDRRREFTFRNDLGNNCRPA